MRLLFSEMKFMQNKRTKIAWTYAMIKVVSLNSSMKYLLPSKSSSAKLYLIVIKWINGYIICLFPLWNLKAKKQSVKKKLHWYKIPNQNPPASMCGNYSTWDKKFVVIQSKHTLNTKSFLFLSIFSSTSFVTDPSSCSQLSELFFFFLQQRQFSFSINDVWLGTDSSPTD